MANTLRFKRGLLAGLPSAAVGEPLFTTDTFDLYIGTASGTQKYQKFIASGTTSQLLRGDGSLLTMPIVLTSPSTGQVLKYNGTSWVNDSDAGITGSGTTNYLPKFTGASTLGNSLIQEGTNSIGIGLTPNAFGGTGLQIGVTAINNFGAISRFLNNAYYDSGNNPLYIVSNFSTSYEQQSGYHRWLTAPSGTAGGAITYTERMRLHNTGNLHLGGTSDNGLRFQVTGDGYFSGSVGIGSTGLTDINLRIAKSLGSSVFPVSVYVDGLISSAATSAAAYFQTVASTQNLTFTLPSLYHYRAVQGTFGASSTVTNQYGYIAESTLIGATNNFGFYGNIASGTGRWNLYMNGSADNYLAGDTYIGINTLRASESGVRKLILTGNSATLGPELVFQNEIAADASSHALTFVGIRTNYSIIAQMKVSRRGIMTFHTQDIPAAGAPPERMRIDALGNIGIGTTSTDIFSRSDARNVVISATGASDNMSLQLNAGASGGRGAQIYMGTGGVRYFTIGTNVNETQIGTVTSTPIIFYTNNAEKMRLFADGNFGIGTGNSNAGFKLDVNGTMRVSGASTFNGAATLSINQNAATTFTISNTTSGTASLSSLSVESNASAGVFRVGKYSTTTTPYKILNSSDGYLYNFTAGDISILNDFATGSIKMAAGASATPHLTIASTGAATFSSSVTAASFNGTTNNIFSVSGTEGMRLTSTGLGIGMTPSYKLDVTGSARVSDAIAIGTTPDTNLPFKILKNINSTVGIRFENTSTGNVAYSAVQFGTDVTGGTKFANLVYSSSGITESGAYKQNGTSIINTGTGGLNLLAVDGTIRFFTSSSNGTLRAEIANDGFINHYTGTAPSTNLTDGYRQYSADITAGNAAPHFRTENGAVIKLYQQTTSTTDATYIGGAGTTLTDLDTFDGYRITQIVKALRNAGILQ